MNEHWLKGKKFQTEKFTQQIFKGRLIWGQRRRKRQEG